VQLLLEAAGDLQRPVADQAGLVAFSGGGLAPPEREADVEAEILLGRAEYLAGELGVDGVEDRKSVV
jgi:hypothetical protein